MTLGMSLETFITRDLSVVEHNTLPMETAEHNEDEERHANEKITTEDILGIEFISSKDTVFMFDFY